MKKLDQILHRMERHFQDSTRLAELYQDLMKELLKSRLWSTSSPDGRRIPWRSAAVARGHSSLQAIFDFPGIYVFGTAAGVPRYIGITVGRKTPGTFKKRMRRYLWGQRSQCELAARYDKAVCKKGIDGFPPEIREWYRKHYGNSTVRLKGAVDFAKHGIEGMWIALLPIQRPELIGIIEKHLIPVANKWNLDRKYNSLINIQHLN